MLCEVTYRRNYYLNPLLPTFQLCGNATVFAHVVLLPQQAAAFRVKALKYNLLSIKCQTDTIRGQLANKSHYRDTFLTWVETKQSVKREGLKV